MLPEIAHYPYAVKISLAVQFIKMLPSPTSLVLNLTFDSSLFQINTAWQGAILNSVLPRCTEVWDGVGTVCSLREKKRKLSAT